MRLFLFIGVWALLVTACSAPKNKKTAATLAPPVDELHDIWALESIDGLPISSKKLSKIPYMEIHLNDKRIMGNDGCNEFSGNIESVDAKNIKFGMLVSTKMACPNMALSNEVSKRLEKTRSYELQFLKLVFFDEKNKALMQFKKVD